MSDRRYLVDRAETLRYLGYTGQVVDTSLIGRLDEIANAAQRTASPGYRYRIFPIEKLDEGVRLTGTTLVLPGDDIARHLSGAREAALMTCTLGLSNEREGRRMRLLNPLDAFMFDAAGSALVESVADACNAAIVHEARERGLYCNWRYGPGYGDLPLDVQPAIVRILGAERALGITVTTGNLLVPAKSSTAVIGLFDSPQDDRRSCANCSFRPYCLIRKEGTTCYR